MKTSRNLARTLSLVLATAALAPFAGALGPALTASPAGQEPAPAQDPVPTMAAANALLQAGDFKGAAAAFGAIAKAQPQNAQAVFMHGYTLHASGDLKAAHDVHLAAANFEQFRPIALYNHACVHALWKETDLAFQSLREALDAGFDNLEQLRSDSDMDSLRGDPRFAAILVELGAPAPKAAAPKALADLAPERRFDFYQGEWEMRDGDKVEALVSVAPAFGGQGWRVTMTNPADGAETANALYVYDRAGGVWRQTWMSATGQIVTMAGKLEGAALPLRVESDSAGAALNGRSLFSDIGATAFTYAWQTTSDEGKTWSTVATRSFQRRK
ncbi:MAG: hypothetical protein R3F49_25165 [Planctomycetota bacterium]